MMQKVVRVGIIGGGLMGKEFASAAARWLHLEAFPVRPEIVAVCDPNPAVRDWFQSRVPSLELATDRRTEFLAHPLDVVYAAVPHYLHEEVYVDVIRAGRHLFAEKPFGMDLAQCDRIIAELELQPDVRCRVSSEFPYFPAVQRMIEMFHKGAFGDVFEIRAAFNHCSDLNPDKPLNWKRQARFNGEYGCLGDLGMHVCHVPFRLGFHPASVSAVLSNIVKQRRDSAGELIDCDTWDNATLLCRTAEGIPMLLETKRISPGDTNSWSIELYGTEASARFSTQNPKLLQTLLYRPNEDQVWSALATGSQSTYPSVTGPIFEFGFSDAIQQMWANYLVELHGDTPVFGCVTPHEARLSHQLFTAALRSHSLKQEIAL
ncbi:MAG: Gfo/Idh/MocA family oxidoreductase [Fimbriimonadaceae bacterium]|nr:Gfo/Idh/MocA family oxidoreductase [Fimbriimonadaceae bacterium]